MHSKLDELLNLDSMLIQVKQEVTLTWYQFGKALGVNENVLDKCLQHPGPPKESLIEVCDNWLRNHTGQPAWSEIAEALRQIGYQQLADNIDNVYNTGMKNLIDT